MAKNNKTSKFAKKLVIFSVIIALSTAGIATFASQDAKATYTEKTPAVVKTATVEEDSNLDEIKLNDMAVEVQSTEIKETEIKETEAKETEIEAAESEESAANNNTTTKKNTTQKSTAPSSTKNNSSSNSRKSTNSNSNAGKSSSSKSSTGSANNGFTTENTKESAASTAPVKLSQAAPYYYNNALSATEKQIYNLLLDGVNSLSSSITLGTNLNKTQIGNAFNALVRDQSQIFWVELSYTIRTRTTYSGNTATTTYTIEPTYNMTSSQVASAQKGLDSAVNTVLGKLNGGMTQFEMELAVHDYIVKNTSYSTAAAKNAGKYPKAYTAYGALVEGSAVCEGYAKAFQLILSKVGIQTTLVSGKTSSGNHMWAMAQIDGSWYHVDPTFDDPTGSNTLLRNYFNLSASEIGKTHTISNPFSVPKAGSTTQNYFGVKGLSFNSYGDSAANKLYNEIVRATKNGEKVVQIRVGGSMSSAVSTLTNAKATNGLSNIKSAAQKATGKTFSKFSYSTDANYGVITVFINY